jgi:hypothetical protein
MADPTLLSDEVLNELEAAVRAELAAHPKEYTEEAAIMLSLIAAARAVRRVEAVVSAYPLAEGGVVRRVREAITGEKP